MALDIIQSLKNQGGLGLFDLQNKDRSLKIQWIKAYYESDEIQTLANQNLLIRDDFFWHGNLKESDIQDLVKPGFWRNVARAWWKYSYTSPMNKVQVLQQHLWFNSNLRKNNGILYKKHAIQFGITLVSHVVEESGHFVNFRTIAELSRNTINFIEYYAIIESFDPMWKRILRQDNILGNSHVHYINHILVTEHISSEVYGNLISRPEAIYFKKKKTGIIPKYQYQYGRILQKFQLHLCCH